MLPSSSGAVHTLAQVLEQEFRDLHESDLLKQTHAPFGQDSTPVTEAKQQQPLADPSLAPADNRAHDHIEKPEDGSTSSQQPDIDPEAAALRKLWDRVHSLAGDGRTALCLSGGGVRSAAFNLGVLQGLARLELLDRFHYLSTVSGGGYIGCWLSAWRHRCERGISDVLEGLSWPDRIRDRKVSPRVPEAISNLRRGTSYLTPAKGILSPDTWATIVIVSRNLLLNHLVIVPLIAAVLLIVKLFGATASHDWLFTPWENWIRSWTRYWSELWFKTEYVGSLLLTGALVTFGWITFSIARPSWDVRRPSPAINTVSLPRYHESFAQVWAPRLGILLVLTGALTFALMAANDIPRGQSSWTWEQFAAFPIAGAGGALLAFVVALGVASLKRALCKSPRSGDPHRMALGLRLRGAYEWGVRVLGVVPEVPPGPVTVPTAGARAVILLALAALVAGGAGGLVLGAGEEAAAYLPNTPWSTSLVLSIAPLWLVLSYDVGDAVYLGLTVRRPRLRAGLEWSDSWGDEEREWVARTGGYLTVITLGISILCLLTLFGAELIKFVMSFPWTGPVGLAILAILSALASIGLAASPFSTQFGTAPKGVQLPVRTILAIATPIFAALLIVLLSAALDLVLFKKPLLDLLSQEVRVDSLWFDPRTISGHVGLLGSALFLALFSRIAAGFVNINRFSLYDLYRMRLTREFLGASNRNS